MLDLLLARLRNFDFPLGRLRRLLDERVQHDDATPNQRAEENPRDTFGTFEPQFEQAVTHRVRVGWPKMGTNSNHPAGKNHVPRSQCVGQREDLLFNLFAVVFDRVIHNQL